MWVFLAIAQAAEVDVGLGARKLTNPYQKMPFALHGFVRVGLTPYLAVEGGVSLGNPVVQPSNLTQTVVFIASEVDDDTTFRQPVASEAVTADVLLVLSPLPRPESDGLTLWPTGSLGVSGLLMRRFDATVSEAYRLDGAGDPATLNSTGSTFHPAATAAVGFEAMWQGRVGVRLTAMIRGYRGMEPDFGDLDASGQPAVLDQRWYFGGLAQVDVVVHL